MKYSAIAAACIVGLSACVHEPIVGEEIFTQTVGPLPQDTSNIGEPCDSNIVYFDQQILPILISSCAIPGCHDQGGHQDGVILTSYASVMASGEVDPFDLNGSDLYENLIETDPDKIMPPPPNAPLTASEIDLIAQWILQGAQNNGCDPFAGGCDLANVTWSGNISHLLQTKCVGCHSGASPQAGVNLNSWGGANLVAMDGRLGAVVQHQAGYPAMPPSGFMLPQCEIDRILAWVQDGAPNN